MSCRLDKDKLQQDRRSWVQVRIVSILGLKVVFSSHGQLLMLLEMTELWVRAGRCPASLQDRLHTCSHAGQRLALWWSGVSGLCAQQSLVVCTMDVIAYSLCRTWRGWNHVTLMMDVPNYLRWPILYLLRILPLEFVVWRVEAAAVSKDSNEGWGWINCLSWTLA